MEVRTNIDDEFMNDLMNKMNISKPGPITKEAFTLLNWAVNEVIKGRIILSSNADGGEIKQLSMPSLDNVKKQN